MTHPRFFEKKTKRTKEEIEIGDSVSFVTCRDFKKAKRIIYLQLLMQTVALVVLFILQRI